MSATPSAPAAPSRRYDLDWLRVLGTITVLLFHCTRFFDGGSWHVKNNLTAGWLDLVIGAVTQWLMPLFFVISGASIYLALRPKRAGAFVWSRVLRLGMPWVLGMLVIGPPQVYFERVTANGYDGSLLHFYLNDYFGHGIYSEGNFALTGMHLWYVAWLLVFTLALLPLFLALRTGVGQRVTRALANVFAHPGAVLALALLVPVAQVVDAAFDLLWEEAAWRLLVYAVLLLLGYLLMSDDRYRVALRRAWPVALAAALLSMVAMFIVWDFADEISDAQYVLQWTIRGVGAWCWIVAFLGLAQRYLTSTNRFLQYSNEAVLPFYILHQTVILTVGFFIRDWPLAIGVKWLLLVAASFGIIMGLYEGAIRRVPVLRFIFGMGKAAPRTPRS